MIINVMTNLSQNTLTPIFSFSRSDNKELTLDPEMGIFELHNKIGRFHTDVIGQSVPQDVFSRATKVIVTSKDGAKYNAHGPFNPEHTMIIVKPL